MYITELTYRACETPYNIEISLLYTLLYTEHYNNIIYFDTCEVHAVIGYFVVSNVK